MADFEFLFKIGVFKKIGSSVDITLPGARKELGHKHPISRIIDEVNQIFIGLLRIGYIRFGI